MEAASTLPETGPVLVEGQGRSAIQTHGHPMP